MCAYICLFDLLCTCVHAVHVCSAYVHAHTHTQTCMDTHRHTCMRARAPACTHAQACDVFHPCKDVHAQEWSSSSALCHAE